MNNVYGKLSLKYPELTKLPDPSQPFNTVYYINTKGPPVAAKPRRLAPDRLNIAKAEFLCMIQLKRMRPSKSSYLRNGTWCQKKFLSSGDQLVIIVHLMNRQLKKIILYPASSNSGRNYMVNKCLVTSISPKCTIKSRSRIPIRGAPVEIFSVFLNIKN
ncbi:hypothetical protein AVEN_107914-1 [Araneus ventricosus]|uniref:Uncharacterized protein n=1 Tax=Araneus ventricosus TaxID=182803 RepID=A0A4Y1ZYX1_ARAVE|nr:hypothetical protein AVEN_107914-1 [Araneus ventricosus]